VSSDNGPTVEAYRELVASLRDQVGFLRQELETRSRELEGRAEEVRRRDALLDAMAQRLRQLPAPVDRPDEYRTVIQAAVVPAEEIGRLKAELEQARRRVAEFEAVTDELERVQAAEASRRPWWRFWG
jgi:DNA repair exonuclease SbcCD ATPase subunit